MLWFQFHDSVYYLKTFTIIFLQLGDLKWNDAPSKFNDCYFHSSILTTRTAKLP